MTPSTSSHSPVRFLRSSLRLSVPLGVVGSVLVAAPALAAPPESWPETDPVSALDMLLLLVLIPLGVALLIGLAVYVPALVRGEKVAPNSAPVDDQWLGGPRQGRAELPAGRESEESGGASGRW